MRACFVSLVGTQSMGVWQPWSALAKKSKSLKSYLLATQQVSALASRLVAFGKERGLTDTTVITIPTALNREESAPNVLRSLAMSARQDGLSFCFNLDGGLNYMVSACVLAVWDVGPILLQASETRIVTHDLAQDKCTVLSMPDALSVSDILALQDVSYDRAGQASQFTALLAASGVVLPQGACTGIVIDGITFDVVWNQGNNKLAFLKDCRPYAEEARQRRIVHERNIAHFASDRNRCFQIFDKSCVAITQNTQSAERLEVESLGKMRVCLVQAAQKNFNRLQSALFRRAAFEKEKVLLPPKVKTQEMLADDTLIVCAGTNVVTTLLAICSHAPRNLVICYTHQGQVVKAVSTLQKYAQALGVETVRLVSVSIEGLFFESLLPKPCVGAHVAVNITPGSKGQGARLALWAVRHACSVWTIHGRIGACVEVNGQGQIPLTLCDPVLLFHCMGQRLLHEGERVDALLAKDRDCMETILRLMQKAALSGSKLVFGVTPLRDKDAELFRVSDDILCLRKGKEKMRFSMAGGEWFEKLAAVAFSKAGVANVRLRVRVRWNERNEQATHNRGLFRLDLDVVGTLGGSVLIVSCKSGYRKETVGPAAKEVLCTGAALGRFCLRMLVHMACDEPHFYRNSVLVIGWRELCAPDRLAEMIETLRRAQSTT